MIKNKKEIKMSEEQLKKRRKKHRIYIKEKYHNDAEYRRKQRLSTKLYRQNNKLKILSRRYNISIKNIQFCLDRAKGKCEICKEKKKLVLDHSHRTNKIRGMLCRECNMVLGRLGDSIENITKFLNYLKR